jgi:hypothetical protein
MAGFTTLTDAWPVPGRSMATARGFTAGRIAGCGGKAAAGLAQSPKACSASAKPCSGVMSPVSTRTALSGR